MRTTGVDGLRTLLRRAIRDLGPSRILASAAAGAVASIITVSYAVSLAALVFRDQLTPWLADGAGLMLWSTMVVGLAAALFSSLPGTIPSAGGKTAAILAVTATGVTDDVAAADRFPTVLAIMVGATLATAVVCLLLGAFRLGRLVRYVPYPVIGGFMAAAGMLAVLGGWSLLSAGEAPTDLTDTTIAGSVAPGLLVAVAALAALRDRAHRYALPVVLVVAPLVLHVGFAVADVGRSGAGERGWLLFPAAGGSLWSPARVTEIADADWYAVFSDAGVVFSIVVLVVMSLLFYAHALELATDTDIDLHEELRSTGVGSLAAALGGGAPAYTNLDASLVSVRIGGPMRGGAIFAALFAGAAMVLGGRLLELVPTALVGGILIAFGTSTLVEWIWKSRHRFARFEVEIVVAIVVAVALFGFVAGTIFGIGLAVALFVLRYSRVSVIRHELSGSVITSNVDRTPSERRRLESQSAQVLVLELRGYLFFGTATAVAEAVARRSTPPRELRAVVFDFSKVTGVDSSTVVAFETIGRLAARAGTTLYVAGAVPNIEDLLLRPIARRGDVTVVSTDDIDRALERCEDDMLVDGRASDGRPPRHVTVHDLLAPVLDDDAVDSLLTHLERRPFDAGDVLMEQGAVSSGLFFLESGRLTARRRIDPAADRRLRTMLPGTVVGEIGLYLDQPATATVQADEASVVWWLSPVAFAHLMACDPRAAAVLHLYVARVLADRVNHTERVTRRLRE